MKKEKKIEGVTFFSKLATSHKKTGIPVYKCKQSKAESTCSAKVFPPLFVQL